ncbi:hypothetical protein SAMN04489751_3696 [Brevibacterium sandarakinum]|uniref:Uncharacterized protein n=1 Tax=Brevibacterium sandarakinum TaxID=629680 RepID=A0A1H1XEZ6_BRESA|nr:DUF6506 family protein [Brevibacterium sandarakinum]SDT07808.1 hypothetical protein SAMN04489751_3696 [Brevibacterium sandarakinum]
MTENTAVIYEGTPGVRLRAPGLTIVGSTGEDLVSTAAESVDQGFERIELCGGVGALEANAVRAAVGGRARLGLVRYGFESLERIAGFKQAFAAGEILGPQAFLYPDDEGTEEVEHPDVTLIPIESIEQAESVGRRLAEAHAGLVELYRGLTLEHAAAVLRGSGGEVPVGFVGYDD